MTTLINIIKDEQGAQIVADVVSTLNRTRANQEKVFDSVIETSDSESFIQIADVLKGPTNCDAAVIEGISDRQNGSDDTEIAVVRLTVNVIVRLNVSRLPGGDKSKMMDRVRWISDVVRKALLIDRGRGGKTNLITFNGTVLDGTDVRGAPRLLTTPNAAFASFVIPVVCGYSVMS